MRNNLQGPIPEGTIFIDGCVFFPKGTACRDKKATATGYYRHLDHGDPPCEECIKAHSDKCVAYRRERRKDPVFYKAELVYNRDRRRAARKARSK